MELSPSLSRTPLYGNHVALGAKLVPFAGWEMPIQYSGILAEAQAVRSGAGLFDVSHMGRLYISGQDACALLEKVVTNGVGDLKTGRARYSMVCDEEGGIIDDVVFYHLEEQRFLLVCNAANRARVVPWIEGWAEGERLRVTIDDRTEETVMMALQGPEARDKLLSLLGRDQLPEGLERPFWASEEEIDGISTLIGHTGYTGEDGFELMLDGGSGPLFWDRLTDMGVVPCGLGARDVLRLEAGLALHGSDIDTTTTPLEAGLDRFVRLDKEFVGAEVLRRQQEAGVPRRLVGLKVQGRALARPGYALLHDGDKIGVVTSGTYSRTLGTSIAMGYVPPEHAVPGESLEVDVRGTPVPAEVVALPFYSRRKQAQ